MLKNAGVALLPLIEGLRAAGAVGLRYAAGSRRMVGAIRAAPAGLFLREFLEAPAGVGAVWPSSEHLARGMAARICSTGGCRRIACGWWNVLRRSCGICAGGFRG